MLLFSWTTKGIACPTKPMLLWAEVVIAGIAEHIYTAHMATL
jgi:hypothetical protein